jgi:copper(I)-binding protein
MKHFLAALALACGALAASSALSGQAGVAAEHAWLRASPKGATTGAAYVTLVNQAGSDDRLVGASSPVADEIQFHEEQNDGGVMKMTRLSDLVIHSGTPVVLKPSGIHMMLIGLKQQLKEGAEIPLTLNFEKGGTVLVTARVGKIGAMDSPDIASGSGE